MRELLLACVFLSACSSNDASPPCTNCNEPKICDEVSVLTAEGCVRVGVTECAPGFVSEAPRCTPKLPETCAKGTFGVPGDETCHAPTTIALDGTIVYVDAAAADGGDGSPAKPFRTIQAAVNAAPADARISIAAGSYRENVRVARRLLLIGVGADKVEISGIDSNRAAVEVRADATVAGVAVTGGGLGISVTDANATISNVWVHDTRVVGVNVDVTTGTTTARVEHSLIEAAGYAGVAVFGADVEIVASAIRDTQFLDGTGGPGALGALYKGKRPKLTVRGSLIERNHEVGVGVAGGDLVVEDSLIRQTEAMRDGTAGNGVLASYDRATRTMPTLLVRRSVVENSREIGIAINGGEGTIEQTVVSDTLFRTADNYYGVGIQADPGVTLTIRNTFVTKSRHMGIAFFGSGGAIDDTIVRETLLDGDNKSAVGIAIAEAEGSRANVTITRALADRNFVAGVLVSASDATLVDCSVRNTQGRADGIFGDGVVGLGRDGDHLPNLTITGLTAYKNARAGVTLFGGNAVIGRSQLTCNAFDLNVEAYPAPVTLKDDGENQCGCSERAVCRAQSNTLLVQVQPVRGGR